MHESGKYVIQKLEMNAVNFLCLKNASLRHLIYAAYHISIDLAVISLQDINRQFGTVLSKYIFHSLKSSLTESS